MSRRYNSGKSDTRTKKREICARKGRSISDPNDREVFLYSCMKKTLPQLRRMKALGAVKHSAKKVHAAAQSQWLKHNDTPVRQLGVSIVLERYRFGPGYFAEACIRKPGATNYHAHRKTCATSRDTSDIRKFSPTGNRLRKPGTAQSPTVAVKRALAALSRKLK